MTIPAPLDLTAGGEHRDYLAIFRHLRELIPAVAPEWTHQGEDDLGIGLLQLFAYLADHLHNRNDTTVRDLLAGSTTDRELLRKMGLWLSYLARRPDAALVDQRFSLTTAQAKDVVIPKGTRVTGSAGGVQLTFETLEDHVLPAGELYTFVTMAEGETVELANLGVAEGKPNERFLLGDPEAIYAGRFDDIQVYFDGVLGLWTPHGLTARPYDQAYWVVQVDGGDLEIRTGDGRVGRIVSPDTTVQATYRRGGGSRGRIPAGTLSTLAQNIYNQDGQQVPFVVTNPFRSFGGNDEENIELIRTRAPKFFATQGRAVTRTDYAFQAVSAPGVHRARAMRVGINGVKIYLVADGASEGAALTSEALRRIQTMLDYVRMATDVVTLQEASMVPVDVTLEVFARPNQRRATVREAVRRRFFEPPDPEALKARDPLILRGEAGGILHQASNDIEQFLRESDMIRAIETLDGVDYLNVGVYTRRPTFRWVTQTGNATVSDGPDISGATVEEVWRIIFLTPTTFRAVGSVTGVQSSIGTLGALWASDGGEVSLLLTAGTVAMAAGDEAEIRVSAMRGNIQLLPDEFPVPGRLDIDVKGGV